ncbi:MAG TPA: hypothetical protein DD381_08080 [Lentisphaeria bacterium]|nr:MAG: hypothetical protein A2X47_04645 [Lentisphaerae bacterium GWF2_38_69]HBM16280.1 hypothetical protein [Lentisphaeria bacterium]
MFFLKLNWKCICSIAIFYISFVTVLSLPAIGDTVSSSSDLLNRIPKNNNNSSSVVGLANALLNAEKERSKFLYYNMFLSDIFSGQTDTDLSERYLNCIEDLEENSRNGLYLVDKVFDMCRYFEGRIDEMPLSYEEKLKMKLRLEELRNDAENYGMTLKRNSDAQNPTECLVLETNRELQVVILGIGFLDNSRTGTVWVIPEAENAEAKVVAVRPYASAALITKGKLEKVSTGMKAKTLNK